MFTNQAQRMIDQAKGYAHSLGQDVLTPEALLIASQFAEGRVLLTLCTGLSAEDLLERIQAPEYPVAAFGGPMSLSKEAGGIVDLAHKLAVSVPDRTHPGLISLRHLVCALAMSRPACEQLGARLLPEKEAIQLLAKWSASDDEVPALGEMTERLRKLRAHLLERAFGQDHAIQAFVEGLFNAELLASGDENRKKPQATFVFAGPPGVGKTFLAELASEALERPFKRFDMSSYSDAQQYLDLVGWPPSFQAAKPGFLTEYVKNNPRAVLLFDEIEKAHLTTINLFLQILDAGVLEDKFSVEQVRFKDTIIIFTTNAGTTLYDHPNESGVTAANASFHRRTVLDALRTEKNATGQFAFPQALCSRLATGYPILFNRLGMNDLERIARTEISRVAGLIERQYYKHITYDSFLPLALVLREGISADARTICSQCNSFLHSELFKLTELFTTRKLEHVWRSVDRLHFSFELAETDRPEVKSLFEPAVNSQVLLVAAESLNSFYQQNIPGVRWLTATNREDAFQILAREDVDLVLLDIWMGAEWSHDLLSASIRSFDFVPLGARALQTGQEFLRDMHERLPNVPVFLLSFEEPGREKGSVDEGLLQACIRSGGARGACTVTRMPRAEEDWSSARQDFVDRLGQIALQLYREKKAVALGQEQKVLMFSSVPAVDREKNQITIRIKDLRLGWAMAAGDVGEVIQDVERPRIHFSDVFGAEAAKDSLQFVVDWLRNPRRYAALGVRPPKGILLTGDPGTGKTMLARAVAGESDAAFLVASGTDFVTMWQGSGPQNMRELFARARRYAPSIVFIDELDAIGKKRQGIAGVGQAEEVTLNALLTEMDGFGAPTLRPVIVLAATNLADQIDEALRRRFDRVLEVPPPDRKARSAFLGHELLGKSFSQVTEDGIESLAGRSAGMTIADLKRIVNEAAIMAARQDSALTNSVLEEAFEKVRMGEAARTPDAVTLERIARHEAGHALVGWALGSLPVQVTIVGRGSAGGYVEKEAQEDKMIYTRAELEDMICQAMGGRAAELLYYGKKDGLSSGAASDLRHASIWAERMIREFGMSEEIGQVFLGGRSDSDGKMAERVSQAAEKLVHGQLDRAQELLTTHKGKLDVLSAELLDKNRLTRPDLEKLLSERSTKRG